LVDLAARDLLRGEVAELAVGAHSGIHLERVDVRAGDPKVGDLYVAVDRDQHVGWTDVPMHDSERVPAAIGCAVHGVEAVQDLTH